MKYVNIPEHLYELACEYEKRTRNREDTHDLDMGDVFVFGSENLYDNYEIRDYFGWHDRTRFSHMVVEYYETCSKHEMIEEICGRASE